MSADKRKTILIVFAGLAAVLLGVIVLVSPTFRNENVSGAIGAVQKHRQPQIAKSDVILGDEKARQEQKVLYTDFLSDAKALRNLSADVAVAARDAQAESRLMSVDQQVEARKADLRARFAGNMSDELVAIKSLLSADIEGLGRKKLESMRAEVDALGVFIENRDSLKDEDLEALAARLAAVSDDLEARLAARKLRAESELGRMVSNVEANLDAAKSNLKYAADALEARSAAAMLRIQSDYLEMIAKEAKTLNHADSTLEALASEANVESRKRLADSLSAELAVEAENLEARALKNMDLQIESYSEDVNALGKMSESLDAANRSLNTRAAANQEALESFRADESAFARKLQNYTADVQAHIAAAMKSQLRQLSEQLEAREALRARVASLDDAQLAARLASESALEALSARLANLSEAAESRKLASALADSQEFATQVHALEQQVQDLQARKR